MDENRIGDLYALSCAIVCGLGNIPAKVAVEGLTPEIFNIYYFSFACILSAFFLLEKKTRREVLNVSPRILGLIFVLAILFALALYLFITSLKLIEPATVSFLSRFEVILTVILAFFLLKEKLTAVELIGGLIALGGIFILKYHTNLAISKAATLMVLSSLLFAVAEVIIKKNIKRLGTIKFLFYRNIFMVFIMYVILLIRGQNLYLPPAKTLWLILIAALLLPVLGRATYMEALKRINISRAALISQSTPLFTALFAFAILRSLPVPIEWLGGGLIILGVVVVQLSRKKILTENRIERQS
nr:DMT family transporter [candidate division Zixibacteria bacterium]